MVMFLEDDGVVEWERAVMPLPPEYVWPWSTWVALRRKAEDKEPHNMTLLMQHAYARCPLPRCWDIRKLPASPTEEELPPPRPELFERRYVPKNYVSKHRKEVQSRFILPRFKNIPARTDSNIRRVEKGIEVTEAN